MEKPLELVTFLNSWESICLSMMGMIVVWLIGMVVAFIIIAIFWELIWSRK